MEETKIIILLAIFLGFIYYIISKNKRIKQKKILSYLRNLKAPNNSMVKVINNNTPIFYFTERFKKDHFSELDKLGRAGTAFAVISKRKMPKEARKSISAVTPTGWNNKQYRRLNNEYLFNRCHLIGFQLNGENANKLNLITGTKSFNTKGMLPFETQVANYVKKTNKKVLYRVTPIYNKNCLIARGVQLEAQSISDGGKGLCFNVFIFNREQHIDIDYKNGKSKYLKK